MPILKRAAQHGDFSPPQCGVRVVNFGARRPRTSAQLSVPKPVQGSTDRRGLSRAEVRVRMG